MDIKKPKLALAPKILTIGPDVLQCIFAFSTFTAHDYTTQALVCKEFRANLKTGTEYLCPRMQFDLDCIQPEHYTRELYTNITSSRLMTLRDFDSTRTVTLINNGQNIDWRHVSLPPMTQKLVLEGLNLCYPIRVLPTPLTELVLMSCRLTCNSLETLNIPNLCILRIEGYALSRSDLETCWRLVKRCPTVQEVWVTGVRVSLGYILGKICREPLCMRVPTHGLVGSAIWFTNPRGDIEAIQSTFCAAHADATMQDLRRVRRCRFPHCETRPSYGTIGGNRPTVCAAHADFKTMERIH